MQISSVSFISVLKIGISRHSCDIFIRLMTSIQKVYSFILFTWEQVSKCQFLWFIFHVRIEMSQPSIIPALIGNFLMTYVLMENIENIVYQFKKLLVIWGNKSFITWLPMGVDQKLKESWLVYLKRHPQANKNKQTVKLVLILVIHFLFVMIQ